MLRLSRWECFYFCFIQACGAIMLAVATGTTICCSLGQQYWRQFHQHIYARLFFTNDKKLLFAGCHMPKKGWRFSAQRVLLFLQFAGNFALFNIRFLPKMLMKLTPGVNFTNSLWAAFLYQSFLRHFYVLTIWVCNFLAKGFWCKSCS